jgi:archaellum biogenesis ATPase FlaH
MDTNAGPTNHVAAAVAQREQAVASFFTALAGLVDEGKVMLNFLIKQELAERAAERERHASRQQQSGRH